MKMTEFCDHLYDESTDGYIQILKLNDENTEYIAPYFLNYEI